jgi:hypothetical protein
MLGSKQTAQQQLGGNFHKGDVSMTNLKTIIPQTPVQKPAPDLEFLLDTIDATEGLWQELLAPYPLFMEELRRALSLAVGVRDGK